jgi:hypothetical protein
MTNGTENLGYVGVARRETLTDPSLSPSSWAQSYAGPLAEHPLLHGLLMELPPKGSPPDTAWLDRWFEATRSILELIYAEPMSPR